MLKKSREMEGGGKKKLEDEEKKRPLPELCLASPRAEREKLFLAL